MVWTEKRNKTKSVGQIKWKNELEKNQSGTNFAKYQTNVI